MKIIINIDDGTNEIIEIPSSVSVKRGAPSGDAELELARREAQEQLAADLAERAPEAAKAIAELLTERSKDRQVRIDALDTAAQAAREDANLGAALGG